VHWLISLASAAALTHAPTSPGADFDAYANSPWVVATEIPAGRSRWNARDEIAAATQRQVAALLEDAARAAPGSLARKVADFRAAAVNQAAIERQELAPLQPMLARIDAARDKGALARLLGASMLSDADPLNVGTYESAHWLGLAVGPGNHGDRTNLVFLVQGGLGLGNPEPYLADDASRRNDYQRYLAHLMELTGMEPSADRAAAVLQLEIALARVHATADASADEGRANNLWTRADFSRRAPGFDWTQFFEAAGLGSQPTFVAWQPEAIQGAAALVESQPLSTWLDYLRVRALDDYADVLPRAFQESFAALRGARNPDAVTAGLEVLIGPLYAGRYFPPARKARVDLIVRNVSAAFRRRVEAVSWLTPASRKAALTKLGAVYFGIGYPERWPDYSTLVVNAAEPIGNRQRLAEWNYRATLARVGQPVDPAAWWIAPQTPGAVLLFNQNAYNFAAALLQPPKYDASASDAMSYGAIGVIVGHELSHFVDSLGADYDATGARLRWWTPEDLAGYESATAPLVRQYSSYSIPSGEHLDGKLMLVENVADLAGLNAAFDAYRLTLGDRIRDPAYVRQQDRDFFLGFAHAWRSRYRDEALRKQVATDHAPERFRIATVRNLDAWYRAFDVKPGQALYLDPRARVRVW
jgi:predicted metalloendopeptidase